MKTHVPPAIVRLEVSLLDEHGERGAHPTARADPGHDMAAHVSLRHADLARDVEPFIPDPIIIDTGEPDRDTVGHPYVIPAPRPPSSSAGRRCHDRPAARRWCESRPSCTDAERWGAGWRGRAVAWEHWPEQGHEKEQVSDGGEGPRTSHSPRPRAFVRRSIGLTAGTTRGLVPPATRSRGQVSGSDAPEKREHRAGFMPLTDCAPLVVAATAGFDVRHDIRIVLSREPSWASVRVKFLGGELDAAHVPYGLVYAMQLGLDPVRHDMAAVLDASRHIEQRMDVAALARLIADPAYVNTPAACDRNPAGRALRRRTRPPLGRRPCDLLPPGRRGELLAAVGRSIGPTFAPTRPRGPASPCRGNRCVAPCSSMAWSGTAPTPRPMPGFPLHT